MPIASSIAVPTETKASAIASGHPVGPILPLSSAGNNYCHAAAGVVRVVVLAAALATPPVVASWTSWANIAV